MSVMAKVNVNEFIGRPYTRTLDPLTPQADAAAQLQPEILNEIKTSVSLNIDEDSHLCTRQTTGVS